jgi:hypothetical protein
MHLPAPITDLPWLLLLNNNFKISAGHRFNFLSINNRRFTL